MKTRILEQIEARRKRNQESDKAVARMTGQTVRELEVDLSKKDGQ